MDNINININQREKTLQEKIIESIEKNHLIENFNTNLNEIFKTEQNQIIKKNIYFIFILKYKNSRNLFHMLKKYKTNKLILGTVTPSVYIYSLLYIYLKFESREILEKLYKKKYTNKCISFVNFIKLIRFFYRNQLINWRNLLNIIKYLMHQIKTLNNELQKDLKISALSNCLKFFGKIIKDIEEKEKGKEEINKDIKKELLDDLFEILVNSKNDLNNSTFMRTMIKEESIFVLIEIIAKTKFFSESNKKYIEFNLIKMLINNFRREHLNYLYKIFRRILMKYNNFSQNLDEDKEPYYNSINKDFSYLMKINEILIEVIKEEREQLTQQNSYYCDKGFVFNNKEKERFGFVVKDVKYNKKNNNIFCILFSFQLKESKYKNESKIIFSLLDTENNEKITIFENGTHINLRYYTNKKNEIEMCKLQYNTIFNFLLFNDKNSIKICINDNDIFSEKISDFKLPDKFKVFVGYPENDTSKIIKEYSFIGIIYPILLFELNEPKKKDHYIAFKYYLTKLKNKYYLIAELFFNYKNNFEIIKNKEDFEINKIIHKYEIYHVLGEDLIKLKQAGKLLKIINNIILYINPYVLINSFYKKSLTYKDYNIYENETKKNIRYYYDFNIIPSLEQGKIYPFRDFSVVTFFKINNGINYLIMQIETLFNFILLLNAKEEYIKLSYKNIYTFYNLINNYISQNLQLFSYFINNPKQKGENSEIKKNEIKYNNKYISTFLFSAFKLIEQLNEIFKEYSIDEQILDDFINILKIFDNNDGNDNIYLRNKLINSLFNNNLYKNNKNLINKLMNKITNLNYNINSREILLNIIQINYDSDEGYAYILIKTILNIMEDRDISELLKYIKQTQYLNFISGIEVIFWHIISENTVYKYKNNDDIKNSLFEIFKGIINDYKNIEIKKEKNNLNYEESYNKCLYELISLLIQLSDNYNLDKDFYEIINHFLGKIKNEKLIINIFKTLFFELYETKEYLYEYINNKINTDILNIKLIDWDLYKYLEKIINLNFEPKKEIISELFYFLEKIKIDYEKSTNTKNSTSICLFTHIFNSKKIINGIFYLLSEYQKNMTKLQNKKYYLKEEFKGYNKLISFLFRNIQSPGYFYTIINFLNDEKIFVEKIVFIEEIIQIISLEYDKNKDDKNKNKFFYQNSIELIEIFYLSLKFQNLFNDKNYEDIFMNYFYFMKINKFIFSPYLIQINDTYKTILEYIFDISAHFGFNNLNILFNEDQNIKNYILKTKNYNEKDYENNKFNKYLKSLKFKINEKPEIIHLFEVLYKIINCDKIIETFIKEIKTNDNWKKFEKENEEIKIIRNSDIIQINDYFNDKISEINENTNENDIKKNMIFQNNNENDCPLKKHCLLLKNKEQSKSKKLHNINRHDEKDIYFGNFTELDLDNIILCMKRDLLLKECSAYYYDIYFSDKNFINMKKLFLYKYLNHLTIKLRNEIDKLNYPVELKNYSNNKYAYPQIFFRPCTSFYNKETLKISHSYFNKNVIKKPSFPYFRPHYCELKSIVQNNKDKITIFNLESELIKKKRIICGNLFLNKSMLFFINNNEIKSEYRKDIKYLFSSLAEDIITKDKIIIIKIKDIEEIITRRYFYNYHAIEIFLKNGKSYFFNLYSKEYLKQFLDKISELKDINNNINININIITDPIKYFIDKNYYNKWVDDELSTYQYLLYINKFSSRSFNDINQYPIFPWIFRESSLGSLLNKGQIPKLRNLRYPMSIKWKSLDIENKKFEELEEPKSFFDESYKENKKYPYHFKSHYSMWQYIIYFLVRTSPFTEEQIKFLDNQLDYPSRQLNSIDETLCTTHDNIELIPEFFTTVEFLLNMNYIYFGYRSRDKSLINDVVQQRYFSSLAQYLYYNRLVLNIKFDFDDVNKDWYKEGELKINQWINLIFGCEQWSEIPKRDDLNLFGKYCYKQYINFEKKLDKYKEKKYDESTIINKIETKKLKILNLGQCPEVLFNKSHKENFLHQSEKGDEKTDDLDALSEGGFQIIFCFEKYEKESNKKFTIVNFWVTQNNKDIYNDYIYFLVFEEKKPNELYIFIYKDDNSERYKPLYIIKIDEIHLFLSKAKIEKRIKTSKNSFNNEEDKKNKEYLNYYSYKLSPVYLMFDICFNQRLYFFVGRNIDNSLKIYEIKTESNKEGKLIYNIPMDSFVSCVYKINENNFFTGHKNGKIYEWKITITYTLDKKGNKNSKISNIEIIRDLIAHKDSMVCCVYYIEKHKLLLTSSNDGKLFIRKYYDFELLSVIQTKKQENIIKFVYTDYDILYLLISVKVKNKIKSYINVYTLNGLLLESSKLDYFMDIQPMKNGKIFCNLINSDKLIIFGFNEPKGYIEDYNILKYIEIKRNKECKPLNDITNKVILNFIFNLKNNVFYTLLENKYLFRQRISDFNCIYRGINKLKNFDEERKKEQYLSKRKESLNTSDLIL